MSALDEAVAAREAFFALDLGDPRAGSLLEAVVQAMQRLNAQEMREFLKEMP